MHSDAVRDTSAFAAMTFLRLSVRVWSIGVLPLLSRARPITEPERSPVVAMLGPLWFLPNRR